MTGLVNNLQMALDISSSFSWERLMSTMAKPLRASCKHTSQANEHDWTREGTPASAKEQTRTFELTKSTFKSSTTIHLLAEILPKTYIFGVSFSNPICGSGHN